MNLPSYRYWLAALTLFSLISCGEKSAEKDLERVSNETERHTRGATMVRGEYVETLRDLYPEDVGQVGSESETHIRFRKWVCKADGTQKSCKGAGAVPVDYLIRSAVVNPLTIEVVAPDEAGGESGYGVRFQCAKSSSQHCVIFQRIGGVGVNYERCEKRGCSSEESDWEAHVSELAQARGKEGVEWIACRSEKACEKVAAAFGDMIAYASGRPVINSEKKFRETIAEIHDDAVGATSRQRFNRENTFKFSTGSLTSRDVVYRTDDFRLGDDGRIRLTVRACARDKEGGCENDGNWQTEVALVDAADLDPVLIGVDDQSANEIAEDAAFGRKGILMGGPCREQNKCVKAPDGTRATHRFSFPCLTIEACRSAEKKLEAAAIFAATPAGKAMTEAARTKISAVTEIKNMSHARRVAKALTRRMISKKTIDVENFFSFYAFNAQTSELDDFNDLVLRGTGRDCVLEVCEDSAKQQLKPVDATVRIDFRTLDADDIQVQESVKKDDPFRVRIAGDIENPIIDYRFGGLLAFRDHFVDIACASPKQCKALAEEVRGLALFAKAQEDERIDDAAALEKLDAVIGDLKKHTDGARYSAFDDEFNQFIVFKMNYIRVDAEGALRVGILGCFEEKAEDCNADADWGNSISKLSPKDIDQSFILIDAFDKDGKSVSGGFHIRWDELAEEGRSFDIYAVCEGETQCIDHGDLGEGDTLFIPCNGEASCKGAIDGLHTLSRLAHSRAYEVAVAAHRDRLQEGTAIKSRRQARQAASRIAKDLTDGSFRLSQDQSEQYNLVQRKTRFDSEATLVIETDIEKVITGAGQSADASAGETHINLRQLDRDEIRVGNPDDVTGWFLRLSCADNAECVSNDFYDQNMFSKGWTVTCRDLNSCEERARDLRGLVDFAGGGRASGGDGREEVDSVDRMPDRRDEAAPSNTEAPRKLRRHLSALNDATRNGAIYIRAAEGPSFRKLQALEASIDDEGRMTARRRVCLALLAENRRQENECRLDTLYHPYDLEIILAELDAGSVDVDNYDAGATGEGWWIKATCRKEEVACGRLIVPTNPTHLRFQSETLMRSFLETERDPKIRIPCTSEKDCKEGAKALRALINAAPKPKRVKEKTRRGGDIVGVWSFQSTHPTGWVIEFRSDGRYTFTMPNARIDGTYTAKNGTYSLRARQPNSDDDGTYRLLDNDTLELAGRLGVGVWRRVEGG